MRNLKYVIALVLLSAGTLASAAISSGYYRVKSNAYSGRYMGENFSSHQLFTTMNNSTTDYSLVWYIAASGSSVTLKNVLTDRYVQKQGGFSSIYSTGTSSATFTVAETGSTYTFSDYNGSGLHCSASQNYNVVHWNTIGNDAVASVWQLEPASVNSTELNNQRAAFVSVSTSTLNTYFTTTACTELKSPYSEYTETQLRSAMTSLPTTIQDLALKIRNNSWTTYPGWSKTEKTFRIADYHAYSNHDRWRSVFGFANYTMGRLSNPTGIWADDGDVLQVYVGAIPSGQSVKLEVAGYGEAYGMQYALTQGMNCLQISNGGNCFVNYEVDNTTNGGTPFKLMSNYADVTVHIEGGKVQGYFDLTKGDTDNDWTQMKSHLLTDVTNRPSVCLKTDKHVMNLGITRLINALDGTSMVEMLTLWRNLAQWEDELMGRSDEYGGQDTYGQYCNTLFSVTALPGTSGAPHCSNFGTYYYEYSDPKIFNANRLKTVADDLWCIAHEQGHSRQSPINMVGNTEISNNLFANVAIYKQGRYTSRTASIQEVFRDFDAGMSWPERLAKACDSYGNYNQQLLRLNWQLYLYFHIVGKDPDFFPRLFDALRSDPMTNVKSGKADNSTLTPASTDYLKYYVKCCQVSGYDLTDFFAAYGFFIVPPERDYSITYNGYTTNRFQTINDYGYYYLYATQSMIDSAREQVKGMNLPKCNIVFIEDRVTAPDAMYEGHAAGEKRAINPDAAVSAFGEVGDMGQYTDFIDNVTPAACSYNVTDRGHVVVTGGEGAVGFVVYDANGNPIAFANTRSFTIPANVTNYTIKAAAADGTKSVSATLDSSIEIEDFPKTDKWYTFASKGQVGRYTQSNGIGEGLTGTLGNSGNAKQWRFALRAGETETFDIINRADGSYISPVVEWNVQVSTSATQPEKGWKIEAVGDYYIIYCGGTQLNQASSSLSYKIYNWGGGSDTSDNCLFTIATVVADVNDETDIAENATDAVSAGTQMSSEEAIVSGKAYLVYYVGNGTPAYMKDTGSEYTGKSDPNPTKNAVYYFTTGSANGTWKVQNHITGKYWGTPSENAAVYIGSESGGDWTLNFQDSGNVAPSCNEHSWNRSGSILHPWSTGTANVNQFRIFEVAPSSTPLSEFENKDIRVNNTAAATIETGQWYVMFDRGANHGYLYEKTSSHTLYNTNTAPSGSAIDNAKYLVRVVGSDGNYYLQTGFGNYFGEITQSNAVPTTALKEQLITIGKISGTDAHYYLASSAGRILDANALTNGDATVVGWGTTVPTATGGNNDWAFYPIEFVESEESMMAQVYTINNTNTNRGALTYEPSKSTTYVWSSGKSGATAFDASNANHQWVIIPTGTDEQYYLYNVGADKFAIPTGISQGANIPWVFSDNAVAVIFEKQSDGTSKIKMASTPVSGTNAAYMAVSNNYTGPIINYNDVGGNFTITKVAGASARTQAEAAVARLVKSQTALTSYPQASGWYAIQVKSKTGSDSYAGRYLQTATSLYNNLYPLTFTGGVDVQPAITDPSFLTYIEHTSWNQNKWQLPDGRYLVSNSSNKFPTPSSTSGNVICGYDNGNYFKSSANYYADPYNSNANYFIGETSYKRTAYTVYPIDLAAAGLSAWKILSEDAPETAQITCSRSDVHGLTSVYKNGYIFLPSSVTPASTDFTLDGATEVTVDATDKTITLAYDPNLAIIADGVTVAQGYQTAGRGGEVMLLKVNAAPFRDAAGVSLTISLKDGAEANISSLTLYEASTSSPEILSAGNAGAPTKTQVATTNIDGSSATVSLAIGGLTAGTHYYWLGATVKSDATLGAVIDAAVTGITYTCNNIETTLDLTSVGDPADRGAMVFNTHSYPFLPRDNGSRVYRIPAMVVADDGSIIVACDKRYDSYTDIGNGHVIDIVVRRSTDGGKTWSEPVTIAKGLGSADDAKCGYGDPSLVKGKDGKIYCLFVAGNIGYFYGQQRIAMSTSSDNGVTWSSNETTPPIDLLESGRLKNYNTVGDAGYGLYDYFVTSGRGLYIPEDDILMYLIPAQTMTSASEHTGNSQDYIFYSRDGGESWYFSSQIMFAGGDEAKIIQMNDGSLLGSIRQGYNRGFNTATYTKNNDGTLSFTMGTQWNNTQLNSGGYANNQDIFYYQRESASGKADVIIHSMTTGQHANLKLYYSLDQGANWIEFLNVQTKGTRYVTMDRSGTEKNPGSLYLFFEDQSLNEAGGYTDFNHYPLNFIEITREQLKQYIPALNTPEILVGDVNLDGHVTIADVTALVDILLGKGTAELDVADINHDGSVTIADVTALVNIILHE